MRIRNRKLTLPLLGGILFLVVLTADLWATTVERNGRQILVDGAPFTIKGVVYSPVPIGIDPETTPPYGDYFTSDHSAIYDRDLPLLRQMGVNTIRIMGWNNEADHSDFLDKAYNGGIDPIYVIVTFWMGPPLYTDISTPSARIKIKSDFRAMVAAHKNHPAILMWSIGNELNAPWMYGDRLDDLFRLINEMADEAHQEEGTNYHPVITPLVDSDLINTISVYDASMNFLDAWGVNVYRGQSFGTLFDEYQAVSSKPLVILEFGIDAYDNQHNDEYENIGLPYQAIYVHDLWKEIEANRDVCSGGVIMAYSDEWWKGKFSTDTGCPDNDPSFHSKCGYATAAHPDGYANEEWWGIMRSLDNGDAPDIMEPREIYYTLQYLWRGIAECPSYIFFGETLTCTIDTPGEMDTYIFTADANDRVMIAMAVTSGGLDPQIRLYGPDGKIVCSASYWPGGSTEIYDCSLPSAGTYTLLVNDDGDTETGDYTIYLRLATPGVLEVTPAEGFVSSGFMYGPFAPGSKTYTIRNTGDEPLDWMVSNMQNWITLSATAGTLTAGASRTITVSINTNANSLSPGIYNDTITFTNVTNGMGNTTRSVELTVRDPNQAILLPLGTSQAIYAQIAPPLLFETLIPDGVSDFFLFVQKNTAWSGTLEIYKEGNLVKSATTWDDSLVHIPSPAAGSYITKVSGSGSGVIRALSALPELTLGEWTVGTIYRSYGSAWYQLYVPEGQSLLSVAVETIGL